MLNRTRAFASGDVPIMGNLNKGTKMFRWLSSIGMCSLIPHMPPSRWDGVLVVCLHSSLLSGFPCLLFLLRGVFFGLKRVCWCPSSGEEEWRVSGSRCSPSLSEDDAVDPSDAELVAHVDAESLEEDGCQRRWMMRCRSEESVWSSERWKSSDFEVWGDDVGVGSRRSLCRWAGQCGKWMTASVSGLEIYIWKNNKKNVSES